MGTNRSKYEVWYSCRKKSLNIIHFHFHKDSFIFEINLIIFFDMKYWTKHMLVNFILFPIKVKFKAIHYFDKMRLKLISLLSEFWIKKNSLEIIVHIQFSSWSNVMKWNFTKTIIHVCSQGFSFINIVYLMKLDVTFYWQKNKQMNFCLSNRNQFSTILHSWWIN